MTEETGAPGAVLAPPVPPSAPVTAGSLLREAREAAGLHIAALAVSMKVPVSKLEALEADRFDLLPDAVFARALASGVCRALKMDSRQVLDKLPALAKPTLKENERGIDAPFRSPSDGPGPGLLDSLSWPVVAVGSLLIAAAAVYFYPHRAEAPAPAPLLDPAGEKPGQVTQSPEAPPQAATGTVVEAPVPAISPPAQPLAEPPLQAVSAAPVKLAQVAPPPVAQAPVPQPVAAPAPARQAVASQPVPAQPAPRLAASAAGAVQPRASQPQAAPVVLAAKPAASAPKAVASAPTLAASAAQPQPVAFAGSSGAVVLKARAASWVSVVDARGVSLLNKTLAPGEVAAASGAGPLKVTVGKADGTEVLVRGQPFNMAPVSRENVARFEVK
jgi:cytoskeleton protein RodZ